MDEPQKTPLEHYEALIAEGELHSDPAQLRIVEELERLYRYLESDQFLGKRSVFQSWFKRDKHPSFSGLYIWGGVGRGKSMLMDLFFDHVLFRRKKRIHFHAFMRDVHARIFAWRQLNTEGDLIERVAEEIAKECRVLCLDEIQVHDVTDAMILSKLFCCLFDMGVIVVFTSNRPPQELYQAGLQRDQFEQFIQLLERRMEILKLQSDTDYRLEKLKGLASVYMCPLSDKADDAIQKLYVTLTQGKSSSPVKVEVQGRTLLVERTRMGVAWFTFDELCEKALGAADYIEIAKEFHTIILQNIPQLSPEYRNEAKRFVMLIDAIYEHKAKFICSAAAKPEALYPKGDGSFEFERTVSRLIEMQSEDYLKSSHISA